MHYGEKITLLWQSKKTYTHHALLNEQGVVCLANFGWFFITLDREVLGCDDEWAEEIKRKEVKKVATLDEDKNMYKAMQLYGGGFIKSLAELLTHADNDNYQRLEKAFPEYFEKYRGMSLYLPEEEK